MASDEHLMTSKVDLDSNPPTGIVTMPYQNGFGPKDIVQSVDSDYVEECSEIEFLQFEMPYSSCKKCRKKKFSASDLIASTDCDHLERCNSAMFPTATRRVSFADNNFGNPANKLGEIKLNFNSCRRRSSHGVYTPKMDAVEFRKRGKEMIDYVADYLESIDEFRVFPLVEPGYLHKLLPSEAPLKPENWEDIMHDVETVIMPGVTHWHHPNFHAYYPGGNSYAAMCGDILSGGIGCITFTWASSPACTELEVVMMDWLAKMLQLPKEYLSESGTGGGVIYSTCSEATLVSLFAARNKIIDEECKKNPENNPYLMLGKLVGYYSDEAHSSVERAGLLSMIKMRTVKTVDRKLSGPILQAMIEEDIEKGLIPFYCVATIGTTGSCAFDNLEEIGPICKRYNIWLHVDAAYAGSACICPEFRYLLNGIEFAMSFVFNPHKWMLVNFDCSAAWYRHSKYVVESFAVDPMYLKYKDGGKPMDFRRWHIQFGCRFRSLKVWFVLRLYGIDGLRKYIRNHIKLAKIFEHLITSDERFELVEKVTLGLVCFRLKASNDANHELHTKIQNDGRIHLVTSVFHDPEILYLRFVICYQFATEEHIRYAFDTITEMANEMDLPEPRSSS